MRPVGMPVAQPTANASPTTSANCARAGGSSARGRRGEERGAAGAGSAWREPTVGRGSDASPRVRRGTSGHLGAPRSRAPPRHAAPPSPPRPARLRATPPPPARPPSASVPPERSRARGVRHARRTPPPPPLRARPRPRRAPLRALPCTHAAGR
eukprot:4396531-Prymnesium_polylepis.1